MSGSEEQILSQRNILRIETPNPYSSSTTNCYFIDGDMPTLIDTGLATQKAYDAISTALSRSGRRIRDIRRIILTHGHADHRALARRLCEESGAEIFCHRREAGKTIGGPERDADSQRNWKHDFFRSMGVPEGELPRLVEAPANPSVAPRPDSASFLDDGDEISLDAFKLKVLHTPGHSCGSICLHDDEAGILFTGDTVLSGSHVAALLEVEMIRADSTYNGLKLHRESLRRLAGLGASWALPGHGPVFGECGPIVEALLNRHRKRQRHILRSLRNGRRTLYHICRSTFPFMTPNDLFLALSEVVGNLGILIDEEKVAEAQDEKLVYYEKA